MLKNPKVGSEIWFTSSYTSCLIKGEIKGVYDTGVKVRWKEYGNGDAAYGTSGVAFENAWDTLDEAKAAMTKREEEKKEKYRGMINSVEDLALFCFIHCVAHAEEYTDWEARDVAEEKFKEFGILKGETEA